MPAKRDPDRVIHKFQEELVPLRTLWSEMLDTLGAGRGLPSELTVERLQKEVTADSFLRLAVAFEAFRSEWHITAIHKRSQAFAEHLRDQVDRRLNGDDKTQAARNFTHLNLPSSLSLQRVRDLVDPLGRNVTVSASPPRKEQAWEKRAKQELEAPYRTAVTQLPTEDWRLMRAVETLRNHLAHRSAHSVDEMNSALLALDANRDGELKPKGLQRIKSDGVPRYLWAWSTGSGGPPRARMGLYYERLNDLADRLRTS